MSWFLSSFSCFYSWSYLVSAAVLQEERDHHSITGILFLHHSITGILLFLHHSITGILLSLCTLWCLGMAEAVCRYSQACFWISPELVGCKCSRSGNMWNTGMCPNKYSRLETNNFFSVCRKCGWSHPSTDLWNSCYELYTARPCFYSGVIGAF